MGSGRESGLVVPAFRSALPMCIPVMTSFIVIGISYGLFVTSNGLPGWYAPLMAVVIFGGSMEFVATAMLLGAFAPLETVIVAFMIQSRHIFYGIPMLRRYDFGGWKKAYVVYALCDESFSINCVSEPPEDVDKGWYYFAVSFLNQFCWVSGAAIGGLVGDILPFDTSGFGFVMTALFTVILVDHMLKDRRPVPLIIGIVASVGSLFVFGPGSFLVPSLVVMTLLLLLFRTSAGKGAGQ